MLLLGCIFCKRVQYDDHGFSFRNIAGMSGNLWDIQAYFYSALRKIFPVNLIVKREYQNIFSLLSGLELKNKLVLDVGTGTGSVLYMLPENCKIIAVDSSIGMLKTVMKRYQCQYYLVAADLNVLPFKANKFDLVTAVGVLEYQKQIKQCLFNIAGILKSTGYALITFSQLNIFNLLRNVLGHRIHTAAFVDFKKFIDAVGLKYISQKTSLMQNQVLLCKK